MHKNAPSGRAEPDVEAIRRGYETRDVNIRVLISLLVGFVGVMSILGGGLWWFYRYEIRQSAGGAPRSAVQARAFGDAPPLQPQEGHEAIDAWDLQKMREQEDATFEKLGWRRDEQRHRFAVPPEVIEQLQQRQATTRPTGGGR